MPTPCGAPAGELGGSDVTIGKAKSGLLSFKIKFVPDGANAGGAGAGLLSKGAALLDTAKALIPGTGHDAATKGRLEVHVISARDLMAKDRGGTSDPYVLLELGKEKHRTKTIKKTLNPSWDETFDFPGTLGELVAKPLTFKLYDQDTGTMNDPLGEIAFPIDGLLTTGQKTCRMLLHPSLAPPRPRRSLLLSRYDERYLTE